MSVRLQSILVTQSIDNKGGPQQDHTRRLLSYTSQGETTHQSRPSRDGDALRGLRLSLARVRHGEHPVFHRSLDLLGLGNDTLVAICATRSKNHAYLHALGDGERAREAAKAALANDVAILVAVRLELGLAGDGEQVVVYVDGHVLLVDAGQLEGRGHEVLVFVLVNVDPGWVV